MCNLVMLNACVALRCLWPHSPSPVQTMMSHLNPAKLKGKLVRVGDFPPGVCLRSYRRPLTDLIALAWHYGWNVGDLSYQEYCAAYLATLCMSAAAALRGPGGNMDGAVDYEGLTDMLAGSVIQNHFGMPVDKSTRARIAVVVRVYSKSKADAWAWEEDAK